MTEIATRVREHYSAARLADRIRSALLTVAPDDQTLTVAQLAPLDQFHVRGVLATAELAGSVGLTPSTRVLDLGSGIGGPARYLAANFGCHVTGVDLSPDFVETATYLTQRSGLADRVNFRVGDALQTPFNGASFDAIFLQHVAMNIEDRGALYSEVHRILAPGGRFAIYDVVRRAGGVFYPVPWARDESTSFLLTEVETRSALEQAGFKADLWRDDTQPAREWFEANLAGPPPSGPNLGLVIGPDFRLFTANLARNLGENRLGVLSAVLTHD